MVRETLPSNADVDTLTARVDSGVLTIVVDKLPVTEEVEEVVEEEPTIVSIRRKNRK
jgi:HSP20 family molecular chaperone IbpA